MPEEPRWKTLFLICHISHTVTYRNNNEKLYFIVIACSMHKNLHHLYQYLCINTHRVWSNMWYTQISTKCSTVSKMFTYLSHSSQLKNSPFSPKYCMTSGNPTCSSVTKASTVNSNIAPSSLRIHGSLWTEILYYTTFLFTNTINIMWETIKNNGWHSVSVWLYCC